MAASSVSAPSVAIPHGATWLGRPTAVLSCVPSCLAPCGSSSSSSSRSVRWHRLRLRAVAPARPAADPSSVEVAVIGAGPVGLFTALVLARRGFRRIKVFDRLREPPAPEASVWGDVTRSYNIGLGGRGQVSLTAAGAMDRVDRWCQTVVGRLDWPADGGDPTESLTTRKYLTKVIARDRLTSCLLEEVRESHPEVQIEFSVECASASLGTNGAELELQRCAASDSAAEECEVLGDGRFSVTADLVIGADGVNSTIRSEMARAGADCFPTRLEDRRPTTYRTLPIPVPDGDRTDYNLSVRNGDIGIEALPSVEGQVAGVVLFPPEDERIARLKKGEDVRDLFEELFPTWPTPRISDAAFEAFAHRPNAKLPQFMFSGPELNFRGQAVLLGDAIHSVKPYFGLGVNSAFEDVMVLDRCLQEADCDLAVALPAYSKARAPEAQSLVECQYSLDQPPGPGFFINFLLPLILDGFFSNAFPQVFAPNLIRLLQDEEFSFVEVKRRKMQDRMLQVVSLSGAAGLLLSGVAVAGDALSRAQQQGI